MLGVVLTGGRGTRLNPVTLFINKSLLPVGNKPLVYYPISTLVKSGIKHILVVIGGEFSQQVVEMVNFLKPDFKGINFQFVKQEKPLGMADAIACAKDFACRKPIIVAAGDNVFGENYRRYLKNFTKGEISFLRKVSDPSLFACPIYKGNRLVDIVEKPKKPSSKYAITGPHIFDNKVFSFIKDLKPSERGELEIVDLHKKYLSLKELKLVKVKDFFSDAGTFGSLAETSYQVLKQARLKKLF